MKIVIDISEEDYTDCLHYVVDKDNCHSYSDFNLREIIRNGQVLPEGHGDLIYRDTLVRDVEAYLMNTDNLHYVDLDNAENYNCGIRSALEDISNAPAIIKADRGDMCEDSN